MVVRSPRGATLTALALVIAFGALAALGACSAFSSSDDGVLPDGGGTSDGVSTEVDAASADSGRINLLLNGDFEVGCASWNTANATLQAEPIARSGAQSCRACQQANVVYFMYADVKGTFEPGARYAAEAHLRAVPGGPAAATMRARLVLMAGTSPLEVDLSSGPPLDDTWRPISAQIRITRAGGTALRLEIQSFSSCFLVDDAVLYRVP